MALANVALTDTFDVWRTRTNQLVVQSNFYEVNLPTYAFANSVGASSNTYANSVGAASNAYMIAVQNGSNTTIGIGANTYANSVGAASNAYMIAVQNGSNTAVGTGANAYAATVVGGFANTNAANATYLTVGTVSSARIGPGSYTGITGVGTITTGVWNGTSVAVAYGGTGGNDQATARSGLGLVIGTNVQAYSARLAEIAALAPTADNFIVGNGTSWTLENASAARTSLGLGTIATQASGAVTITGGSISGLSSAFTVTDGAGIVTLNPSGDIYATRTGGTTGAIFLGSSGSRYLYYDGTTYQMHGAGLNLGGGFSAAGDITATGDITAFSSDARLKGDIQTITEALSKVKLITGVTYVHNDIAKSFGYTDEKRLAGVLAQEVEAVLPEVVVPAPFDVADDGTSKSGENYKTVKYEKIVPLLIEAIKELTAKVEMLESRVKE